MSQPNLFLTTPRLRFRRFTREDADLLYDLDSDPEVMRYISKGQPTPRHEIEETILPRWLRYYDQYEHFGFWAVHERASKDFIGWFHLRPDYDEPEAMDLGYRLKRHTWGQGLATEGGKALIQKAFSEWDVSRIVAHTLIGNVASQRVLEKCGLRRLGTFLIREARLPGWTEAERQAVRFALDRDTFASDNSAF